MEEDGSFESKKCARASIREKEKWRNELSKTKKGRKEVAHALWRSRLQS